MAKYKVTLMVESDLDPSQILDNMEYFVEEYLDDVDLDPIAVEDGEAVGVESMD